MGKQVVTLNEATDGLLEGSKREQIAQMISGGNEANVKRMIEAVTAALKRDYGHVLDFSQVEDPDKVLAHLKDRITTGK